MPLLRKWFQSVKLMTRSNYSVALLFLVTLTSTTAHAVNISAYRIYLDEENRDESFVIFNRNPTQQECNLSLAHNDFDTDSKLTHLPSNVTPENSAKDWIRFSPREFLLTPSQSQTVRFTMRRKPNAQDGEYRSYLVIDCGAFQDPNKPNVQISLQTKLVHSVPIIVRSGQLDATVWIDNIRTDEKTIEFTVNRKGTRSVYGDVELIDKTSGKTIAMQRNFSIYPESARYHFKLARDGIEPKNLKIRFTENKDYGGNIVVEKDAL